MKFSVNSPHPPPRLILNTLKHWIVCCPGGFSLPSPGWSNILMNLTTPFKLLLFPLSKIEIFSWGVTFTSEGWHSPQLFLRILLWFVEFLIVRRKSIIPVDGWRKFLPKATFSRSEDELISRLKNKRPMYKRVTQYNGLRRVIHI